MAGVISIPAAAIAQARRLAAGGADIVELGAAASNIAAQPVSAEEEIRRLQPVIATLKGDGVPLSIDTFQIETQRFALAARRRLPERYPGIS